MKTKVEAIQQMFSLKWIVKINNKTLHRRGGGIRLYKTSDAAAAAGVKSAIDKGLSVGTVTTKPQRAS